MKKTITLISLLLILIVGLSQARIEQAGEPLKPTNEHRFTTRVATSLLTRYHYQAHPLDDELSERIFTQYLRLLDPNRMYFLASDIEEFQRYRDTLDDALLSAEIEPPFEIFSRYQQRVDERVKHALALLDDESISDFTVDETYQFDRREAPWAESSDELDEIWRKRVKNDWLSLKLADQEAAEIRETLAKRYKTIGKRVGELNGNDVFQYFMNAYATSIEPHTTYLSPRLAENFEISMKLSLDGIGALLSSDGEYVEVQEVIAGGPADLDGRLKAGDRIIGVAQGDEDFVDVVGWRLDDVVDLIRGQRDTRVRLQVVPGKTGLKGPPVVIDLVRDEVKLEEQAAKAEVHEVQTPAGVKRIGVISVPVFYVDFRGRARNEPNYRSSTRDVRRLINELRGQGIDGLIIDLRGNGGGALIEATTMTGLFIDEGPVVQVRDRQGRIEVERDTEPGMAWDGPLAVLVDRGSASASEIFAAAIQDYGRGIIIGEPTFGKGTVQNLFNLDNYAADKDTHLGQLKLTMAKFFRINGGSTQNRGVVPDILLPSFGSPEEYGESALDYAMAWSSIDPVDYEPLADLSPLLPAAVERHRQRLEQEDLKALIEEFRHYDELADRTTVSLLETRRREEQAQAEARRIARLGGEDQQNALPSPDDPEGTAAASDADATASDEDEEADPLLDESVRILADLIELDADQHRLVQARATDAQRKLN
ncbi:MAG: carboxy terminal-processing peptidase [Wenzhouxiangellaceae bacterium]